MKGRLRQRGADPKAWLLVVDLGRDPVTGKRRQKRGSTIEPTKATFGGFSQAWLRDCAKPNLRPADIQQALKAAQDRGLAPKTVRHVHTAIHRVLSHAVSWGLIARNPAESAAARAECVERRTS